MWLVIAALGCSGKDEPGPGPGTPVGDPTDLDQDGFDAVAHGGEDCDDDDASVYPGADEVPYDGVDQDCADGDLVDVDQDGFDHDEECDDADPAVHPEAADTVGDGLDQNCDAIDGEDADRDGWASIASGGEDCDDGDDTVSPGAAEVWYDDVDQDCSRTCDWDQDGDGTVEAGAPTQDGGQCDFDPAPGAVLAPEDCDDTDPLASTHAVDLLFPQDLSATAGPGTIVQATLTLADPAATITLEDAAGVAVAGVSSVTDETITFASDLPLLEGQSYTATLSHACGLEVWTFWVVGPVDEASLEGRTWALDLADGTWVQPAGVGALVGSLIDAELLLSVAAADAGTLDLLAGWGDAYGQDLCTSTIDLPAVSFAANPTLTFGPADVVLDLSGFATTVEDFVVAGTFSADGSVLDDATVSGSLDTRPLVDLIVPGGAADEVCLLVSTFGVDCVDCSDGSGPYCLALQIEDLQAPELPGVSLVERTDADIALDPTCP